jgi:hypothetical protein
VVHSLGLSVSVPALVDVLASHRGAIARWVRQVACGVRGHQMVMCYESTRLSLQCAWCGRETPGWQIGRRVEPRRLDTRGSVGLPRTGHHRRRAA